MTQPWFNPFWFGILYGAVGAGGGGVILGAFGVLMGYLVPRGIGRRWVLGGLLVVAILGWAQLVFGLCALFVGQPYAIWFPPMLAGAIDGVLASILFVVGRIVYAQAEMRRIDAQSIRNH